MKILNFKVFNLFYRNHAMLIILKKRTIIFYLVYILGCFFTIYNYTITAQNLQFNRLSLEEGLSQNDVSSILQDSSGFIWIGTYDGLNKFDGYNVTNYRHDIKDERSLSSNRITCLLEDSQKRIWIGTNGGGLNYYSIETETFHRIKTPYNQKDIKCAIETSSGDILFGTTNGLLIIKKNDKNKIRLIDSPFKQNAINHIIERQGIFYFSTSLGIWMWKNNSFYKIKELQNPHYRSAMSIDQEGNLWTGHKNVIHKISLKNKVTTINLPIETIVNSTCYSKDNLLWIGTNNGLFSYNPKLKKFETKIFPNSLSDNLILEKYVRYLFYDKSNNLWLGTRKGIYYTSLLNKKFNSVPLKSYANNFENYFVTCLTKDGKNIYIGIKNVGIYKISTDNNKKLNPVLKDNITINNSIKIHDKIYFASDKGLYILKNDKISTENSLIKKYLNSICEDSFGNIYVGDDKNLFIKKGNSKEFKQASEIYPILELFKNNPIFNLKYDKSRNCIWAATPTNGIYKLNQNPDGSIKSIENYSNSTKNNYYINNNAVWSIYIDTNETVWIGTDSGLFKLKSNASKFSLIDSEYVINKKIMSIQKDNSGQLWLGNSKGIICYNPKDNKSKIYSHFDGLQSNAYTEASVFSDDGTLYFGGIDGIDYFKPNEIKENKYTPKIILNQFKIHNIEVKPFKKIFGEIVLNKSINLTSKITLSYKQNDFKLDFSSTGYTNKEHINYKYQLIGYDENAITVNGKQNFASYSNLPSGTYQFWVQVANSDGIWNPNKRVIEFTILPPPWFSGWAYFIYILLSISILSAFIYFLYHKQRLNYIIKLKEIQHKQEQEANEMQLDFFTDIAHEFKTPLSLIIGPVNDLVSKKLSKKEQKFSYQVLYKSTKRMHLLVNQLLDFRKINTGNNILKVSKQNLSEFINDISKSFLWQAKSKGIDFSINTPINFECYFDYDLLEKSIYNILSNAFKFTPDKGIIRIDVSEIEIQSIKHAYISIKDSGKGINNEDITKIFNRFHHGKNRYSAGIGLHLTSKLINAHRGNISVENSPYGGAEFIITLPIEQSAYTPEEIHEILENNPFTIRYFEEKNDIETVTPKKDDRILIVEDDSELRNYLKICLQKRYLIIEAENGKQGLTLAERDLPDIIISDVMMPEMDGIEFCQAINQNAKTAHIPIIMLTAKTDEEFRKKGLKAGAWDYLSKPFNTDEVIQKIKNILKTKKFHKAYLLKQDLTSLIKNNYTPHDQKLITDFTKNIIKNMTIEGYTVDDYTKELGMSRMQLHRKIKELTNQSTANFINTIKINYAAEMFDNGCNNIKEAMYAVGINSYTNFNTNFKNIKGVSAKDYIKNK